MSAQEVKEVDVVVVGGGLAGHSAAIEVSKAGKSVAVLEKMPDIGGSTVLSGGSFAFAGTPEQAGQGIDDSPERLRRDLLACAAREQARELIDVYVAHQLDAYRLLRHLGVVFDPIQFSSNQSVPRSHPTSPARVMALMNEHLRQQYGVAVQTSAPVSALHRDPASRRIVAVTARHADRAVEYRARQGVILASGGFSQSPELMSMLAPHLENVLLTGGAGNQGDGLKMAWAHGAAIADIDALVPTFGALQEAVPSEPNTILLAYYRGGIVVNGTGERFVDESKSYKAIGKASMDQAGARGFQIFDQKVMDLSVRSPKTLDFQRAFDLGRVTAADTIVELAERIGIDPQALARTVSEYNDGIRQQRDSFGRRHLSNQVGEAFPLEHPRYYAYATVPYMATTYAGIKVDRRMRVVDVWGKPIDGLYAAGEIIGGAHGRGYMTGASLGKALIFGRVAAWSAISG
ncbi:flavocytochrome c [Bordetella bronchiseptica GA96-01]|uniref:FAD-dependent oxidoreductase n=1 Tax=Bordetella bronchiseptica TaxID=518 RepID=UPI00045B6C39|nr:FAD-dependent oxidoreductase [Bordetella bronchiseptica]AZW30718.1 FAD-binding protein [Bordetella bronchiseptica]KCV44514.1 flavocytochrome c [Bordetella bronchiseptica 345]KDC37097.1 flavocytochrome c [Bordetella bronchiseptica GA96-01]